MKQYNAQLKYVGARPRRDKKLGKGGSAVIAGSATPTGGVSKSYIDSNFVTLATEQAISGRKNFVGGVEVNGQELVYDAEKKVWQLTGDLVVTGAVTMFGSLSGFTPSTVMDAVLVDGTTIVKDGQGRLTVIGGGSGGSGGGLTASEVNLLITKALTPVNDNIATKWTQDDAKISNWNTAYEWGNHASAGYATTSAVSSAISSALTGYATQSWVEGKKYLTGITSSMVTTALGYTPYNAANFTKANIKSTLSISEWALAASKPSYTAAEVGALSTSGGTITTGDIAGFTIYRNNGVYSVVHFYNTQDGNMTDVGYLGAASDGRPVYLNSAGSVFDLIHSGNIGQQSVNYATSAGVADSANEAYRFRTIASVVNQLIDLNTECLGGGLVRNYAGPSYWKNAPDGLAYGMVLTFASGFSSTLQGQLAWDVNHASTVDTTRNLWWRANDQTDFANSKWHQIAFTDSNVASATKLQTARTIWGQSFDGTGNVSGDILSDNIIPTASGSYTLGTANNQWYAIYSIRLHSKAGSDLYIGANDSNNIVIRKNGNIAIGGTTADELLHIHGITKASLFKSVQGYTFPSSAALYCGLVPNSVITSGGNSSDFWLYNTTDIKYQASNHLFVGGNVVIGGATADAKLHVYGDAKVDGTIIVNPSATSDVSITFRSGTASDGLYDYKVGKFTDVNGKSAFGIGMAKADGSYEKFLGVSTGGVYDVTSVDIMTNTTINGALLTTGIITTPQINIGGLAAYKLQDDTLFIDANVVVRGAISMFGVNTLAEMESIEQRLLSLEQKVEQLNA